MTTDTSARTDIEQLGINVIRGLAMDAPQRAKSGHPGTAMALAPLAHVLFTRVMRHDPSEPDWPDRDRFVLSAGHASILLYSMLYLTGYELELDDIKAFRQWGSKTPGHPEVHHTKGIEVTTGPLGQGFANAVGMGVAERYLRARFGSEVCDHHTFVICGDGDMQEGISHEAASLAGHLGLGRLVYVYDDNHITIDGPTELSFSEDVPKRFEAYGWDVDRIGEVANDTDALEAALRRAMAVEDRPSLIVLRSHIGWPSPNKTDTKEAHGEPLGADEIRATKELLGLPPDEDFWVPDEVLELYRQCIPRGQELRGGWQQRFDAMGSGAGSNGASSADGGKAASGADASRAVLEACLDGSGLPGWQDALPAWPVGEQVATRVASGDCLNAIVDLVPSIIAGSADLTGNTGTKLKDQGVQSAAEPAGRQLFYGIREHAMGAMMNGMALHGGVVPVGGTFFNFSDYMRGAVRLAAISEAKVIYSWTHDSVGLGEDGPTHQPVEQLAVMRATPQMLTIRPADANETAQAWKVAIGTNGPTALILSRQKLPVLEGTAEGQLDKGAYVLVDPSGQPPSAPQLVLIGTGSEVSICVEAAERLQGEGVAVRVVSMPSWGLFAAQDESYRNGVLPPGVPKLAVEAATSLGWERWADASVSLDRFGGSAPGTEALHQLGFNADNVTERARELLRTTGGAP